MKKYIPSEVEKRQQELWQAQNLYASDLTAEKKHYVLAEFAYPSGDLHMGHWFTWAGADIYARLKRLQGFTVFFPNGFDAFGLPAENAAIKRNIHPSDWTMANIERMKAQYLTMGASFTFDHQVTSCLPEYYRWNQWIFLKMLEKGLAYRSSSMANWCPNCQTVLANEGVEAGKCWRCGTEVIQKEVPQWFLKITDYADRLLWSDEPSVAWPKAIREAQNDWIGRKEGIVIRYKVAKESNGANVPKPLTQSEARDSSDSSGTYIEVFTTRPDTNFGATFIALAPEHPLVLAITTDDCRKEVEAYIEASKKKTELDRKENREKTGAFTGSFAINNLTGEQMPIWISDFVLMGFGTGALVGVPAHDKRDFEFANRFNLQIKRVVASKDGDTSPITSLEQVQEEEGTMINSGFLDGLDIHEATSKIMDYLEEKGWGKRTTQYHLHDWSISRQRYWGTPIPVIHCPKCGAVPVPEDQLPVELPYDVDYAPKGKSPLASNATWLQVDCPKCQGPAERDADTMDTFVDSSWYFFRYLDPKLETAAFDPNLAKKIMPVDIYFGGAEHTLGHTLYSRFFTKFFKELGLTDLDEYALRRINHGIVLGPDGNKMSKSKGNVVNPDDEVKRYGADAVRTYLAFFMPYEGTGPWISERIWGSYRFLERVWNLYDNVILEQGEAAAIESHQQEILSVAEAPSRMTKEDLYHMHKTIQKVTQDIEAIHFNTAVAALMEWLNYLSKKVTKESEESKEANAEKPLTPLPQVVGFDSSSAVTFAEYKTFLQLLAPIAPHMTDELWQMLGETGSIHNSKWPEVDDQYLEKEEVTVVIQINGKVRDQIVIHSDIVDNEEVVVRMALEAPKVQKFIENASVKKTIYIRGKLVSIVI